MAVPGNNHHESICITKQDLRAKYTGASNTLDMRIKRALKTQKLLKLKNGLYITSTAYLHELDKIKFTEFIASRMYEPSYISLEYVLEKHGLLLPQPNRSITCMTTKTGRTFKNLLGVYTYTNIKPLLFTGFEEQTFNGHAYHIATKDKALFDYLYLNPNLARRNAKQLKHQLFNELNIQWTYFSEQDFEAFSKFVWQSDSAKMQKIWHILNAHFENKKFDEWARELLK